MTGDSENTQGLIYILNKLSHLLFELSLDLKLTAWTRVLTTFTEKND